MTGMVVIQVAFLFTSIKNLMPEQQEKVKAIVASEYGSVFGKSADNIRVSLLDAYSEKNKNDIILAVEMEASVINLGKKRAQVNEKIAGRLSLLGFMKKLGFTGATAMRDKLFETNISETDGAVPEQETSPAGGEVDYQIRASQYQAEVPFYQFGMLQIPESTLEQIDRALARIEYEREIFDEWGLYAIQPNPVCALSFYGPSGTGKSMAADAIASRLGKKIIKTSYANIENKYVGEGPKNVRAVFLAAEQQDAVLFIDEAESLLSKRLINVSEPSAQALNSMRSELLITLERYHGIVVFATNLAANYDHAFESRLISIRFDLPDADMRERIWKAHLYPTKGAKVRLNIPLSDDVDVKALAGAIELCGRDIRSAVIDACVDAKRKHCDSVTHELLCNAAKEVKRKREELEQEETGCVKTARGDAGSYKARQLIADSINRQNEEKKAKETLDLSAI